MVGIDGSFLKGQCKGQLLTTIGWDPNNQVFPIAWVVVDIENKFNWKWFPQLLEVDLGMDRGRGIYVISDKHKGLLEATKEVLPYVEHRQCARHIYAIFKKVYNGIELRNLFWKAAKSIVEGEFKNNMDEITQISPGSYEHLMERELKTWCRAFFSTGLACEVVENGMAECFNAIILDARKKPLLTMLEEIRLYMMVREEDTRQAYCEEEKACLREGWKVLPREGEIEEVVEYLEVEVAFTAGLKEVKPQIQYHPKMVNEEYKSDEMVDVDMVTDGDGLDMANMDYIIQQITQLRNSGCNDVNIMRCLGITKAHLEEFEYVVANVEGGLEGDEYGNKEEEEGNEQGDGVEGGGKGQGNEEEEEEEEEEEGDGKGDGMERGREGQGDGEEEDGEGDGEGVGVEGVEDDDVQGNDDIQGNKDSGEGVEAVSVNDPVQQGHFRNNMQQRTRRPSKRIILQKLKKEVADPLGIGMCQDKALILD
ncbi:unnamed protein product [Lactuca saligna]|uniref:MULE transposase domain-containing protein n=1 Tax=Lactuca saligna TaxID=75948 RepID=A0AA35YGG2_LACSI|nr:unnamed protein product [Lactuca saligna]